MDNFQIETAQNVTLHQNVASATLRIGSFLIDFVIILAYYFLFFLIFNLGSLDSTSSYIYYTLISLPVLFYSLIFEMLMNGQSPGKHLNKIRVVNIDGSKATFGNFLVRWMMRLIDIILGSGSIALLTILLNGKGQRLGDIVAGTTVISERNTVSLEDTINVDIPLEYIPTFPQVTILSDSDIQTIKSIYRKAKRTGNNGTIVKLHLKVINLTGIKSNLTAFDLIETVIKDYNYFTQQ